jgi:hypothetical protein
MGEPVSDAAKAMRDVLQTIPKAERSRDTFLVKLLRPFFRSLPRDVQTRLARDTMIDLAVAHILAKERLGPMGNARLDGNECQIGMIRACGDFDILARGLSWEAAWEMLGEDH